MKTRRFDHIDLRVRDFAVARKFYEKLLPALGFTRDKSDQEWGTFYAETDGVPTEFFGFTEDKNHRPNETRIAFWADTREEVDRITDVVRAAGGLNLEGPQVCPEYTPVTTHCFSKIPTETDWKCAAGKVRSRRNEFRSRIAEDRGGACPRNFVPAETYPVSQTDCDLQNSTRRSIAGSRFFSVLLKQSDGLVGSNF